jgi:hypothetical protein
MHKINDPFSQESSGFPHFYRLSSFKDVEAICRLLNPFCLLITSCVIPTDVHWSVSVHRAPHRTNCKVYMSVLFNFMINLTFTLAEILLSKNASV